MTRINLVPVSELADQHLFAEFREIKMVPRSLNRSIISYRKKYNYRWPEKLKEKIPRLYTLNKGHVTFFYDKGAFLENRFQLLRDELIKRGYNINLEARMDEIGIFKIMFSDWNYDFIPSNEEIEISRERIQQRLLEKPHFYKYYGKPFF